MSLAYYIVDAFTDRAFAGNPAAVVPLTQWPSDTWLQNVAMEMNLAETAFFAPDAGGLKLRWFTPKAEVDLCGHATLASALVLSRLGKLDDGSEISFSTRSGTLKAIRQGRRIELDFPVTPAEPAAAPPGLIESLHIKPKFIGRSTFDYLVEVESEAVLRSIEPDITQLASIPCRGVIVTSASSDPRFDFVSRFFAPAVGVNEDPVTGSAHCCLADFWGKRLGKTQMLASQASHRGGIVHVERKGDRVLLGGEGVIVAQGELLCSESEHFPVLAAV